MTRAPIRFLVTLLILWVGVRAAILMPLFPEEVRPIQVAAATPGEPVAFAAHPTPGAAMASPLTLPLDVAGRKFSPLSRDRPPAPPTGARPATRLSPHLPPRTSRTEPVMAAALRARPSYPPTFAPPPAGASQSRWSLSVWLLVRDDQGNAALAPGGTLGGSQAGARISYALGDGFALSVRAYLPLRQVSGAELAAGLDWRPVRAIPLNLLAERRQRIGREGRNAFALTLYGGASRSLTPRTRLDLYGQAGIVGLRSRDLFVDGSARVARRIGPVDVGAGAWGAAQPGARRLDAGPSLSWRLPVSGAHLRLQADWRFRIAGDAAPRSGPALTLAADF